MSSLNAARDAASKGLGCHSFIPARSCEAQFELLHALKVAANKNEAGYDFEPLDVTMANGAFLAHTESKNTFESLVKTLAAIKDTPIEDSKQAIRDHTDASGSLSSHLPVSMGGGVSSDHGYNLHYENVSSRKMEKTVSQSNMIKECLLDFCNNAAPIHELFNRRPTKASGAIETGVAIVTSTTTGTMYTMAADAFHADANVSASAEAIEVLDASGDYNSKSKKKSYGKGTIGVQVIFFHLIKTRLKPFIRLKDSFSILANDDDRVQNLLGNWATRGWRKIFDFKHKTQGLDRKPAAEGLAMKTGYGNNGSYREERDQLMSEVDEYESMLVVREQTLAASLRQVPFAASLRQVAAPAQVQQLTDGDKMDPHPYFWGENYTKSSNKMLHSVSLDFFESISHTIAKEGNVTLDGKVFDGIKPAIEVEFPGALPIAYERKLSGAVVEDATPGWVLRETRESEDVFTLWKVSGLDEQKHGIVSAHNMQEWCVRESIEYVRKDDHKEIDELQAKGFVQLHSDEADQDDIAETEMALGVGTGDFIIMGRQFIAKKEFWPDDEDAESMSEVAPGGAASLPGSHAKKEFWPDDEDAESMGEVAPGGAAAFPGSHAKKEIWPNQEVAESMGEVATGGAAAFPGSHATGAATARAAPPAQELATVVTNTGTDLTPPKKKPKR